MSVSFAINGLGRIGRALLRIAAERPGLELVAVNDLGSAEELARLVAHDSLHGPYAGEVAATDGVLWLDGREVVVSNVADAGDIPWQETAATVVVDATGLCKSRPLAEAHLRPGVERVIVSANADVDMTICMGINHRVYDPAAHHLISAASCTTNCLAPLAFLLDREYGIRRGMLNTVHSYNNDQRLQDFPHRDPRRARAAALNMIPTTTSAISALEHVMPELVGRLTGLAVRVPTPNVSLVDLVVELERRVDADGANELFRRAAEGELAGILAVEDQPLVSTDYLRRSESAVVDLELTQSIEGRMLRVIAWYDNEWGHASRLADLLELVGAPTSAEEDS